MTPQNIHYYWKNETGQAIGSRCFQKSTDKNCSSPWRSVGVNFFLVVPTQGPKTVFSPLFRHKGVGEGYGLPIYPFALPRHNTKNKRALA